MSAAYAAVDLGAESARVMVGTIADGRIALEQHDRTPNQPVLLPDGLHWDLLHLFAGVLQGLRAPRTELRGVGVDAWGVDYALLDERGRMLGLPFHYRDPRTEGMIERASELVPADELYAVTGIQTMPINTVFQLLAEQGSTALRAAARIALVPDLFAYWLSGELANEATAASTTGLLDAATGEWATSLIGAVRAAGADLRRRRRAGHAARPGARVLMACRRYPSTPSRGTTRRRPSSRLPSPATTRRSSRAAPGRCSASRSTRPC